MPDKHRSWRLTVPGYRPFTMVGDDCTEDEARHAAGLLWPGVKIHIEPGVDAPTKQEHENGQEENRSGI